MKKRMLLALFASTFCGAANAQKVDVNMSENDVEFVFTGNVAGTGLGKSSYDFTALYAERSGDNNWLTGGGFMVSGASRVEVPGLEFGVGIKVYFMEVSKYDVTAFPLGGYVRYSPLMMNRFYAKASAFWAPQVTTLYDGEEFLFTSGQLGFSILPNADLYVGYRDIYVDIKNRDDERLTGTWFAGMQMTF